MEEVTKMISDIRDAFKSEIKNIKSYNYDIIQINTSRQFLDSILEISKGKNELFGISLDSFLNLEYFTHLNYIILIVTRILDNSNINLKNIKNEITKQNGKPEIRNFIKFLNNPKNKQKINEINEKIENSFNSFPNYQRYMLIQQFPNILYINYIQEKFCELSPKLDEVFEIYENLNLVDFRNNYLAYNGKGVSYAMMQDNIYLKNPDFKKLLDEIKNLLDIFHSVLNNLVSYGDFVHPGYSVFDVFKKLEKLVDKEVEQRMAEIKHLQDIVANNQNQSN